MTLKSTGTVTVNDLPTPLLPELNQPEDRFVYFAVAEIAFPSCGLENSQSSATLSASFSLSALLKFYLAKT